MIDPDQIARVIAAVALAAIALSGLIVLGAIALRYSGRRPGRRWGTAVAFLFGVQLGVFFLFTENDPVQRVIVLVVISVLALGLLWRDRRVQAGALIAGCASPWTALWAYYALLLATRAADGEPVQIWTFFVIGLATTLLGLGLMISGDPLQPEPNPRAAPGRPGSRRVGIVARVVLAPESIGGIPISEIASFVSVVVVVLLVGAVGLPFPVEPAAQVALGAAVGSEVRLVARPRRARRAFEAFSWLAEWELERAKAITGRGAPASHHAARTWLTEVPDLPESRWIRVEVLAWLEQLDEARRTAETMPDVSAYERFERRYALDLVDWMAGGDGDPDGVRAAAAELEPADDDSRLRADVALAIRDSARIAADRGPEEALGPLLAARDRLGARADGQLRRALWRRFLPVSIGTAVVITLLGAPFG